MEADLRNCGASEQRVLFNSNLKANVIVRIAWQTFKCFQNSFGRLVRF